MKAKLDSDMRHGRYPARKRRSAPLDSCRRAAVQNSFSLFRGCRVIPPDDLDDIPLVVEEFHFRAAVRSHFQHDALLASRVHERKRRRVVGGPADPDTTVAAIVRLTIGSGP